VEAASNSFAADPPGHGDRVRLPFLEQASPTTNIGPAVPHAGTLPRELASTNRLAEPLFRVELEIDVLFDCGQVATHQQSAIDENRGRAVDVQCDSLVVIGFHSLLGFG
jgi:hypothetical protein